MRMILFGQGDRFQYPTMKFMPDGTNCNLTCIDRKVERHRSGKYYISYLYDDLTEVLIEEMHDNIRDHLDNVIVIHGPEGTGKSHLAYHLCRKFDPNFDVHRNYIYEYDIFLKRITEDMEKPPGTVYWLDEGANIASNRDSMRTDNKEFIKILEMFRSKGWTLIICVPKLDRLDLYIRETRARYIIEAAVMSWDLDDSRRRDARRGYYHLTRCDFKNRYRATKPIGYGMFPPIPDDEAVEYEKIKTGSQEQKLEELNEAKESRGNKRLMDLGRDKRRLMLQLSEDGYSNLRIADILGTTVESVAVTLVKARKEKEQ